MTDHPFRRLVRPEEYFSDEESLRAYSYDGSSLEAAPLAVLRPSTEEQLRHILIHANQQRIPLVPRGAGTGIRGAVVREGAVILDMRSFNRIVRLDSHLGHVDVGAGVTIAHLNRALAEHDFIFPLVVESALATLGGLASQNHITEESLRFGDYNHLVEQLECFDALGRFQTLKDDDVRKVIGKEGTTGIITRLRLKVFPKISIKTMDVIEVKDPEALVDLQRKLKAKDGLLALEYCDATCSELLGVGRTATLVAFYITDAGAYKDPLKTAEVWKRRKHLTKSIFGSEYVNIEEATLSDGQIAGFISLCQKRKAACYGHIGAGVLIAQLEEGNEEKKSGFRNDIVALGALPSGKHGFGRVKAQYAPAELKKEIIMLKEDRDYNHILNPGVIIDEKTLVKRESSALPIEVRRAIYEEENVAFRVTNDLRLSNRHMWYLVEKGIPSSWLYKAMLGQIGQSKEFDDAIIEARRELVKTGIESTANKAVMEKVRAGKNPYV